MTPGEQPASAPGAQHVPADLELILSREQLTVGTEWVVAGRIRLRRRVLTETRTIEVVLRREELQIEVLDVRETDGALIGTNTRGPVTDPPQPREPVVLILQEEVPEVAVRLQPYEKVTVSTRHGAHTAGVTAALRHEELQLDATATPADRQLPLR